MNTLWIVEQLRIILYIPITNKYIFLNCHDNIIIRSHLNDVRYRK